MSHKAVFLDLNGTLVMPVQVNSPDDYHLIDGSIEAVRLLNRAGFLCPVVTVQSRIEKGIYSEPSFRAWFKRLQESFHAQGAAILGPYLCPHSFKTHCLCHKPQPTLYFQAAKEWDIDCDQSYVVGDTLDDIRAGQMLGAKTGFVLTGWASKDIVEGEYQADLVGQNILGLANLIITNSQLS